MDSRHRGQRERIRGSARHRTAGDRSWPRARRGRLLVEEASPRDARPAPRRSRRRLRVRGSDCGGSGAGTGIDAKFSQTGLGLVDASIAALGERLGVYRVLTTDSDFVSVRVGKRWNVSFELAVALPVRPG